MGDMAGLMTTALRETTVGESLYILCEPKERRVTLGEFKRAYGYLRSNGHKQSEPYVFTFALTKTGIRVTRQEDNDDIRFI